MLLHRAAYPNLTCQAPYEPDSERLQDKEVDFVAVCGAYLTEYEIGV